MPSFGSFSGHPITEWVIDDSGSERRMRLIEDFTYTDPTGKVWTAPRGTLIDGASIPRPLWSMVGSPYTGRYRRASVVHDAAYHTKGIGRKEADTMFMHACRAGGCGWEDAMILYAGVRVGGWARKVFSAESQARMERLTREHIEAPDPEEKLLQDKLLEVIKIIRAFKDGDSFNDIDAAIDRCLEQ